MRGTLVILHPCFNHPLNSAARRHPLGAPSPIIHRAVLRWPHEHRHTLQGYRIEHTFAARVSRSQPDGEFPLAVRTSPGWARVPPLAESRLGWRAEGDPPIVAPRGFGPTKGAEAALDLERDEWNSSSWASRPKRCPICFWPLVLDLR